MLGLINPLTEADDKGRGNVNGGARAGTKDLSDPQILNVWYSHSILVFQGNIFIGHAFLREKGIP